MSTVFLCAPDNSTMFTTCCEVAILDDEKFCPKCRQDVTPTGRRSRWEAAYGPIRRRERWYGNHRPCDGWNHA
jgi:hypothetical protein